MEPDSTKISVLSVNDPPPLILMISKVFWALLYITVICIAIAV